MKITRTQLRQLLLREARMLNEKAPEDQTDLDRETVKLIEDAMKAMRIALNKLEEIDFQQFGEGA